MNIATWLAQHWWVTLALAIIIMILIIAGILWIIKKCVEELMRREQEE